MLIPFYRLYPYLLRVENFDGLYELLYPLFFQWGKTTDIITFTWYFYIVTYFKGCTTINLVQQLILSVF